MTRIGTTLMLVSSLVALPGTGTPESYKGQDGRALRAACQRGLLVADSGKAEAASDVADVNYCFAYTTGVAVGLMAGGRLCEPLGVITDDQRARVVFKYLDAHPERLHEHMAILVIDALKSTWPCPPK